MIVGCRTKHGVDHGHVVNCVFERNGLRSVFTQCLRKKRTLDLVLITNGKLDRFGVEQNLRGTIVRRVEGNKHFDTSFRAEKDHALVRRQASAASKGCLTLLEVEYRTRQAVGTELGVSFDQSEHTPRL